MKLTLVRHGETIENVNHIIQGQMPGHLTELGWGQARIAAEKLKNTHFDAIYCSDLQRCVDTAKPIIANHPDIPVIYTEQLRERKGGSFEGKVLDFAYWDKLPGTDSTRHYPGGESWGDVKKRIKPFFNDVYKDHPNQNILFISHGGPIRGLRSYLEHKSLDDVTWEGTPNGSIWSFEVTKPLTP